MNNFECPECGMEFVSEASTAACPKCGSACISSSPAISAPVTSQEGSGVEDKPLYARITEVLKDLSVRTYELPFKGQEWEKEVNKAAEEIAGLLAGAAR